MPDFDNSFYVSGFYDLTKFLYCTGEPGHQISWAGSSRINIQIGTLYSIFHSLPHTAPNFPYLRAGPQFLGRICINLPIHIRVKLGEDDP